MTRHENHDIFARHAAARRLADPDADTPVFGSQKMISLMAAGASLCWGAIILWVVL